jgi:hypothetical protein
MRLHAVEALLELGLLGLRLALRLLGAEVRVDVRELLLVRDPARVDQVVP